MKSVLLASAAFLALGTAAQAEEIGPWSGSYIGVEAGYVYTRPGFDGADRDTGIDAAAFNDDGFIGGVYAGHDWQRGQFVFGVAGDFDYLELQTINASGGYHVGKADNYAYDMDWMASARVRAGFAPTERVLVYGTGGIAFASIQAESQNLDFFNGSFTSDSTDKVRVGGVIGAGFEYRVTENWSMKTEFDYDWFRKVEVGGDNGTEKASFDPSIGAVKLGFAYRF